MDFWVLLQRVGGGGDELRAVLVVSGGWVVEVIVGGGETDAKAFVDGQGEGSRDVCGVVAGIVEGWDDVAEFGQDEFVRKCAVVCLGDS